MAENLQIRSNGALAEVLTGNHSPCISLYQKTHRFNPEKQQNPVRFKKLVKELEKTVHQKYPSKDMSNVLDSFKALGEDLDFWNHSQDGVAVLGAPGLFKVYTLPKAPLNEMVVVGETFHTKPLRRMFQAMDRFQVLALTRSDVELYEGNQYELRKVKLHQDVPRTLEQALGSEVTKANHTMGPTSSQTAGGAHPGMAYGYGGHADEVHIDEERFFRAVDKAVFEHHSKPARLPLILAALPEHHSIFHEVSHNNYLLQEGVRVDPHSLKNGDLKVRAWEIMEPKFKTQLAAFVSDFNEAKSKNLGSDDLKHVAEAAVQGRVATLMIEEERQVKGRLDCSTGALQLDDVNAMDSADVLDDLAELVEVKGGTVLVVSAEEMPTQRGLAAVYRY